MDLQGTILDILHRKSVDGEELSWIKKVSCSSLFKIGDDEYPVVFAEDGDPAVDSDNSISNAFNVNQTEYVDLSVVIITKNIQDYGNEDEYMSYSDDLKAKMKSVKQVLFSALANAPGIGGVTYGQSSINDIKIGSRPAMVMSLKINAQVLSN